MFERTGIGYPCPSLVECLLVFAVLFLLGALWASGIRWYVAYQVRASIHA